MQCRVRNAEPRGTKPSVRFLCFSLLALLMLIGCGGKKPRVGPLAVNPVRGAVTYLGEPLEAAIVTLVPVAANKAQAASQGVTNEEGEFVLSTYNPNDGAPEGQYFVTISCEDRNGKKVGGEFPELLPVRYQSPQTSGLKATIEDGENDLPTFNLVK